MTSLFAFEPLPEDSDAASWKLAVSRIYKSEMPQTSELMPLLNFHFQKLEITTSHLAQFVYSVELANIYNMTPFWAIEIPLSFIGSLLSAGAEDLSKLTASVFWTDVVGLYRHLCNPEVMGPNAIRGAKLLHIAASTAYSDISQAKNPLRGRGWGLSDQELDFASNCSFPIVPNHGREKIAIAIRRNIEETIKLLLASGI